MKANLEYSPPIWPDRVSQRSKSILQLHDIGALGIDQGEKVAKKKRGPGRKKQEGKD